jgi:4-amino-4-deoxy-L-arabinose transferase-like glycosyltransferase
MSEMPSVDDTASSEQYNTREARSRVSTSMVERIDHAPVRAFVLLSIAYFLAVFTLSSVKLMWLDELITLHIAEHGGPAAIWDALAHGADPNPPVSHILVHFSRALFGDHEWAYRLPAVLGYWLGMLSLFAYLRRRVPGAWAIAGTMLSMCMAAFEYSYESRSYGIIYGLAMLAFLCWTLAVDPMRRTRTRTFALLGLIVALAGGISTNYFAVLAFFPVAAGEAVRTFVRARDQKQVGARMPLLRALDLRIWFSLALAATPLIAYRGLIAHSIAQFAPYAWNKVSIDQVFDSYTEMVEMVLFPILVLFIYAVGLWVGVRQATYLCNNCRERVIPGWVRPLVDGHGPTLTIPLHEAVGVFLLMAYPILGYIIASIRGGMLSPRFVIPVCFGFAIAATLIAYQVFGHMRRAATVFLCLMAAWFICRESVIGYWYMQQKQCFYQVLDHLPAALTQVPADAPIAIPDPLLALTFQHYAPPNLASRVVFPVDFPAIREFRHDDSPEENLWAGRGLIYSMPIETVAEFQNTAHKYLIIAKDGNWMLDDLSYHHYLVRRLPINTRATELGGFTPLARGVPFFFTASWDHPLTDISSPLSLPVPFHSAENVPTAKFDGEGGAGE